MLDSVLPAESEPKNVVGSPWLWAARCSALIHAIFFAGEYVAEAHSDPVLAQSGFLYAFGLRSLLSVGLLYFLFRGGKKSLAFALGLGAATGFIAVFGVASNALFWPIGRTFNLVIAMLIFVPVTPPFLEMVHQPDARLATEGLLLFWSFGICSAVLGLSSVVTFEKMARQAKGIRGLQWAFRGGIFCPLVAWLIAMLLLFTLLPFHV
jgi:hypothetical protein